VLVLIGLGLVVAFAGAWGNDSVPVVEAVESPAAAAASEEAAPRVNVTLAAVGDVTMGSTPVLPPDGGAGLFAAVRPYLQGDIVLGNLEQALTDGGTSKCRRRSRRCYAFRTPPSYADNLGRAGFTIMNLANNHSYDFGEAGQADTVRALERVGIRHTGRPGEIANLRVGDARVAVLGFAPYPVAPDLRDIPAAEGLVRRADRTADLVIVTMHAGAEGRDRMHVAPGDELHLGESRGNTVAFAHAVVDAGADLVIGHGPHVLRGMEWYRGRLIAYSLANFSGYRNFSLLSPQDTTAILRATIRADGTWIRGRLVPVRLADPGTPVPDPAKAAHGIVRALSREDFGRRAARITVNGEILRPGPARPGPRAPGRAGELRIVPGGSAVSGSGTVMRFLVEVEGGLRVDPRSVARRVQATLFDRRSWAGSGGFALQRVDSEPVDFRVALASPRLTDELCLPLRTKGIFSCAAGSRAVLNSMRWMRGADAYARLGPYRTYMVNHEVGHTFGHGHVGCPGPGEPAPVMMQQTKGVAPCAPNPWPLPGEL
jgi:poly-gamma-glutamate capsule biosynthesis protein CapA/YwtB (metallophosphatase superfamily)